MHFWGKKLKKDFVFTPSLVTQEKNLNPHSNNLQGEGVGRRVNDRGPRHGHVPCEHIRCHSILHKDRFNLEHSLWYNFLPINLSQNFKMHVHCLWLCSPRWKIFPVESIPFLQFPLSPKTNLYKCLSRHVCL
ncbi:hypothetical protein CFOL_v3_08638 [Cephalotus follicularis]|uniref:Uncharacterized protein n=1 Tax=Cephalotus follicularis TaxID=3775 RepID=A0A1Q3BBH3_CEPFO|nr:hypothetical protein CFOL_v3_08638 [Cephalotus follicularis]